MTDSVGDVGALPSQAGGPPARGGRSREDQTIGDERSREEQKIYAVVVTHRRPDELAKSLDALSAQVRAPDHLVVVDNETTLAYGTW